MKNLIIFLIVCSAFFANAQSSEKITNQKVIELSNKKLGADLIISLFNENECDFKMDVNSVLELKQNNVTETVIMEMMKRSKGQISASKVKSNNPLTNREAGIYAYFTLGDKEMMTKLYANVVSSANAGGFGTAMAKRFSYGMAKTGVRSEISGPTSNVKCPPQSEFYLYFDPTANNSIFSGGSSPNEFILVKLSLNKTGNMREFRRGTSDSYTVNTGIDDDQKVAFEFEEVRPNVFKLTTREKLVPGEYCFIKIAQNSSNYGNNKIYDFSVQ